MNTVTRSIFGIIGLLLGLVAPIATSDIFYNGNSTIRLLVWSISILCCCVFLFFSERTRIIEVASHPISYVFVLFVGWLSLRTAFAWNDFALWGNWSRTNGIWSWGAWFVFMLTAALVFYEFRKMQKVILTAFVVITVAGGLIGNTTGIRLSGLFANPLYFTQLLIFVPWALSELLKNKRHGMKILVASLVPFFVILYFTHVRTAFLACAVAICVYGVERIFHKRNVIKYSVYALCIAAAGVGLFMLGSVPDKISEPTFRIRYIVWQDSLRFISDHWLTGIGFGNHYGVFQMSELRIAQVLFYSHPLDSSHSAYIDLLIIGGAIALALFAAWLVTMYRAVNNITENAHMTAMHRATLAIFAASGIASFFTIWGMVPLALLAAHLINTQTVKEKKVPAAIFVGIRLLSVVIALGSVYIFSTTIVPAQSLQKASAFYNNTSLFFDNVARASGSFIFSRERDMQILSLTAKIFITQQYPEVLKKIESHIVPIYKTYSSRTDLFAEEDNTLAVFASSYGIQLETSERVIWLQDAERLQQSALRKSPGRPASIFHLGEIWLHQGKSVEAVQLLKEYADLHPELPRAREMYELLKSIVAN